MYINIVVLKNQTIIYVQEDDKGHTVNSSYESFDTTTINEKMHNYIESFTKETPFNYISILDTSSHQGAVPSCDKKDILDFFDESVSKYICYKSSWTYYTSKNDLNTLQKHYKKVGLDFVFSPFLILSHFFKDKIKNNFALFILIEEAHISMAVFDNLELCYAEHIVIKSSFDNNSLLLDEDITESLELDLDTIDLDSMEDEGLDDFSDIEDLDGVEDIEEFSESQEIEDITDITDDIDEDDLSSSDELNDDYERFTLIQKSIDIFYKDDKYESKFLEKTFIADAVGMSLEFKRYLEEEMFLATFIRRIDLNVELCEIAKEEIR